MSNEWLLTQQEIENICVKAIYSAPDNELVKDVRLTASQAIACAQLQKVAERIKKMTYEVDRGYDTFWKWNDYESLLQEAGLEAQP